MRLMLAAAVAAHLAGAAVHSLTRRHELRRTARRQLAELLADLAAVLSTEPRT